MLFYTFYFVDQVSRNDPTPTLSLYGTIDTTARLAFVSFFTSIFDFKESAEPSEYIVLSPRLPQNTVKTAGLRPWQVRWNLIFRFDLNDFLKRKMNIKITKIDRYLLLNVYYLNAFFTRLVVEYFCTLIVNQGISFIFFSH